MGRGHDHQMCHLVEASIRKVLNENDNAAILLDLHRSRHEPRPNDLVTSSATRSIKIK